MADSKTGEEDELMLELSIGGIFGKSKKQNPTASGSIKNDNLIMDLKVQSKGNNIQVLRRPELRRKREEKLKKSVDLGSSGSVSGPFVENNEWLEAQIVRQNDEPARKKEKIGDVLEKVGSISLAPVDDDGGRVVAPVDGKVDCVFRPTTCRSFRPYRESVDMKSDEHETDGGVRCCSNGCGSVAYSDGQSSAHRGGATDDSRSNSSNSQLDQQPASTSTASVEPFDQPISSSKQTVSTTNLTTDSTISESNLEPFDHPIGLSKQTVSTTKLTTDSTISESNLVKSNNRSNLHESSVLNPQSKPKTTSQHQQASLLAQMPCVSTTGNGPNGKKVSGFLYRYTKNEVSIVCVCHGRSFSPAGFVEHAGGVDITNPLKHITIFPAAFAS